MKTVLHCAEILLLVAAWVSGAVAQRTSSSVDDAVARSQEALRERNPKMALELTTQALKNFPQDPELRLELARIYIYQGKDRRAAPLLESLLSNSPSRDAKIELARLLGRRGRYKSSDELYREILDADPNDETAAMGLTLNLIHEGRYAEARLEVRQALARHPNSLGMLRYSDFLSGPDKSQTENRNVAYGHVQASESYFADTAGNRSLHSAQSLYYPVNGKLSTNLRLDELYLAKAGVSESKVLSSTDEIELRLHKAFSVVTEGGAVKFPDGRSRSLYTGDARFRIFKELSLTGGYSRLAVTPTLDSAQFDLLGQGWHTRLDWRSSNFHFSGSFSKHHYTDGNRAERERADVLRWIGGRSLAFGAGYVYTHVHFTESLNHGYFSPEQYRSNLAQAGFRLRIGRVFRGEYLGLGGVESILGGAPSPAGEVLLRNQFLLGRWNLAVNYSRYQVAQTTGAFQANSGTVSVGYRF